MVDFGKLRQRRLDNAGKPRVTYLYKCTVCEFVDAYVTELPEALLGRCHQPNIDKCPGTLEKVEGELRVSR